jgi:hypothetical protein
MVEAERRVQQIIADAESHAPGSNLGRRIADHVGEEAAHTRAPDIAEWEVGLNQESRSFLVDNPVSRTAYESMSPEVRQLLTHCASLCVIPNLTRPQITQVQELLNRLGAGAAVDENVMIQLKIYFHIQQDQFPHALEMLEHVNTVNELEREVLQGFRRRAMEPLGAPPAATPRDIRGTPSGGTRLPEVGADDVWLHASTRGRIGLIPQQIAEHLRTQTFNTFDEFRAAFWRAVADDPVLSRGFGKSNMTLMRDGGAPFGPGGQYVLHHITPLEHGGALYDLDNLMVMTSDYHQVGVHNILNAPLNPIQNVR